MENFKSVRDFGALGNGVNDDYAAFQKALDECREIYIPIGVYNIGDTLKIHSDTKIKAEKSAKIVMKSATRRHRNDFLLTNSNFEKGNKNISIEGGIWDGANYLPENQKLDLFDKNGYSGALLNFNNVDGLTLKNMVISNTVTFYVRMSRLHNFVIEDIDFVSDNFGVNQDGLHFGGDVKHGRVKNIRALSYGQTNDDFIALNADDSVERIENLDLARDDIEDITFENLYAENCHTIIRILTVGTTIKNIRFKNVFGGFRCNAINADGARYCRVPIFDDKDYPYGVGNIENIHIENFTCYPVCDLPEDWKGTKTTPKAALLFESLTENFKLSDFRYIKNGKQDVPALKVMNLTNQKIVADGNEYGISAKEDTITVNNFSELKISKG